MLAYKTVETIERTKLIDYDTEDAVFNYYIDQFNSFTDDKNYFGYTEEEKQKAIILKTKIHNNPYTFDDEEDSIIDSLGDKIPLILLTKKQAENIGQGGIFYYIDRWKNRFLAMDADTLEENSNINIKFHGEQYPFLDEYYKFHNIDTKSEHKLFLDVVLIDELIKYQNNPQAFFNKINISDIEDIYPKGKTKA